MRFCNYDGEGASCKLDSRVCSHEGDIAGIRRPTSCEGDGVRGATIELGEGV